MKTYYGNQNRPRYEYTLADLAEMRRRRDAEPDADKRDDLSHIVAMLERRLGIVKPEAVQS